MAVVTMRQLLESGVHFGHQTRRWNPKMKRFIMTERNGIYIIDLQQSLAYIDRSYAFIKETVAKGGTVMFVGTKKELLHLRRERDKLEKTLGGIREMSRTPAAVWVVDTKKEHLAVEEARKLRIPIIGILDTNGYPDEVDCPIPGKDDAIRAVGLLTRVVADAVAEGLIARSGAKPAEGAEAVGAEEPLADWERELLGGDAEKAAVEATGGDTTTEAAS